MTKELSEALLDHFTEGAPSYKTASEAVKAEARLQAERILPLIDRYAAEREKQARIDETEYWRKSGFLPLFDADKRLAALKETTNATE